VSIKETLQQDMKQAMRSGAKLELSALRMALAAIKHKEIENQGELGDSAVTAVLEKMIKQGQDAAGQFAAAGREELAARETAEIEVFERYLPQTLSDTQVEALIAGAIASTGAASVRDMGKVMAAIKSGASGRIDMAAVSGRVREILSAG
jgi:hypothetical protein